MPLASVIPTKTKKKLLLRVGAHTHAAEGMAVNHLSSMRVELASSADLKAAESLVSSLSTIVDANPGATQQLIAIAHARTQGELPQASFFLSLSSACRRLARETEESQQLA